MTQKRVSLIFLAIGLGALGLLVWKLGPSAIWEALVRFAPAFPIILGIEFASNVLSTMGWRLSFTPAERPGVVRLQVVNFASLPLSGALPTGQASEVLKANLLRGQASSGDIVSSLVIYNALHVATTAAVMAVGPLLSLALGGFPTLVAVTLLVVSLGIVTSMAGLGALLRWGLFARVARALARLPIKALRAEGVAAWAADVDERFRAAWRDRRRDVVVASLWLTVARVVQIGEVFVILSYLDVAPTWTMAWMAFAGTALANYLLMVLPAREGFLEGSAFVVFEALGLAGVHGFTLELIRRIRKVAYQLGGLVLLLIVARERRPGLAPGERRPPAA